MTTIYFMRHPEVLKPLFFKKRHPVETECHLSTEDLHTTQ